MLCVRFVPVALNQWSVVTSAQSTRPIATITHRRNEQCSAAIAPGHALNREELAAILDSVADLEDRGRKRKRAA